jgi:ABC-type multidrug transport system fused ATPase/permease subunit
LRIQYYLGIFNKAAKQSKQIFDVLELDKIDSANTEYESHSEKVIPTDKKFIAEITMSDVSFSYTQSAEKKLISQLTLNVSPGEMIAIVGPSGAGKSTLVDLLLGYLKPDGGTILISGESPRDCFKIWSGKVAYVPQKVTIYEDTIFSNISLEAFEKVNEAKITKVLYMLELVGLGEYVRKLPSGIHSQLSESGSSLSGGQIQRIGIARALFSDPEVIIFDESTSSLDSLSESSIMELITSYRYSKTIILIAHRLSTIKSADRVIYLDHGRIKGTGTFDALRSLVPEFEDQVMRQNLDLTEKLE